MIREKDRLLWSANGPVDPSPTVEHAVNGEFA
jgi:hypothetical protein